MSIYVKKEDGTLIESDTEVVKVESDNLSKILKNKTYGAYFFASYKGSSLPELDEEAFANLTNIDDMFEISNIEILPKLKFNNVTSASYLFNQAKKITTIDIELPLATNLSQCFAYCSELKAINLKIGNQEINGTSMFTNCEKLETINVNTTLNFKYCSGLFQKCNSLKSFPTINTSNCKDLSRMFFETKIEIPPLFDTSKATDVSEMFSQWGMEDTILKVIPAYDFSNVTNTSRLVYNAINLEQFLPTGLKVSFDLSASTKLTREALVVVLNNLGTPTSTQTLTLGSTNLAKLTEEDIAIATEKNWTLQ